MKTTIKLHRGVQFLELVHVTDDGHTGTLIIPFSAHAGAVSTERVHDPRGNLIHGTSFPTRNLGDGVDLEPYLIGMTRSAMRCAA